MALAGYLACRPGACKGSPTASWSARVSARRSGCWRGRCCLEGRTRVGVESHGHRRHREILKGAGLSLVALAVDDHGADPSGLGNLDAVVLTPAHQFPLGVALEAAAGAPSSCIGQFPRAESSSRTTTTASFATTAVLSGRCRRSRQSTSSTPAPPARTLAPGLRLAWLVASPSLVDKVVAQRELSDIHTSAFEQLTMAEFIASGRYDRHVRRSRLAYRRRRERLVDALARRVRSAEVRGLSAGMHAVVELGHGLVEAEVVGARGNSRSRCSTV